MAAKKSHAALNELKRKIKHIQRKEEQSRAKLQTALKKMRRLGQTYKIKLAGKVRMMENKIAKARSVTYAKVALDLERQLLKAIDAKGKAIVSVIDRIEKQHASKLKKRVAKKARPVAKGKKSKKSSVKRKKS